MLHLQSEAQAESESQSTGWVNYYFNMHANKAAWIGRVGIFLSILDAKSGIRPLWLHCCMDYVHDIYAKLEQS